MKLISFSDWNFENFRPRDVESNNYLPKVSSQSPRLTACCSAFRHCSRAMRSSRRRQSRRCSWCRSKCRSDTSVILKWKASLVDRVFQSILLFSLWGFLDILAGSGVGSCSDISLLDRLFRWSTSSSEVSLGWWWTVYPEKRGGNKSLTFIVCFHIRTTIKQLAPRLYGYAKPLWLLLRYRRAQ